VVSRTVTQPFFWGGGNRSPIGIASRGIPHGDDVCDLNKLGRRCYSLRHFVTPVPRSTYRVAAYMVCTK
jgi:hypothetical protein